MLKTGEIIRIKENLRVGDYYGSLMYNRNMQEFCGKKLVIIKSFPGMFWAKDTETQEAVALTEEMVVLG